MSISVRNLNKVYPNGNHALKDVCLEIPTGMFGLLGPNGAGKSTLMRILVALMEPTSGEVEICGYDLMRQRKEIRGSIGLICRRISGSLPNIRRMSFWTTPHVFPA